jgi:hypothetical protein
LRENLGRQGDIRRIAARIGSAGEKQERRHD